MPRIFMHKAVHFVLTAMMLLLAYKFADDTMPAFQISHAYDEMARLMFERSWAMICGGIGGIGLITGFLNSWKLRTASAVILGAGHFIVAFLIYLGDKHAIIGSGLFFGYGALGIALAYSTAHLGERIAKDLDPFDLP